MLVTQMLFLAYLMEVCCGFIFVLSSPFGVRKHPCFMLEMACFRSRKGDCQSQCSSKQSHHICLRLIDSLSIRTHLPKACSAARTPAQRLRAASQCLVKLPIFMQSIQQFQDNKHPTNLLHLPSERAGARQ